MMVVMMVWCTLNMMVVVNRLSRNVLGNTAGSAINHGRIWYWRLIVWLMVVMMMVMTMNINISCHE